MHSFPWSGVIECNMSQKPHFTTTNVIRSHKHEVYTKEVNKISLSVNDDKQVVLEDRVHTLTYGHY